MAFKLYAWVDSPSIGVCSNYSFGSSCHFRLIVHFEKRCYCLHESFVWECNQNHPAFMRYAWIDHSTKELIQTTHFEILATLGFSFILKHAVIFTRVLGMNHLFKLESFWNILLFLHELVFATLGHSWFNLESFVQP